MPTELDLLKIEKMTIIILIIAYIIVYISAEKGEQTIIRQEQGLSAPGGPKPTQLAALAAWIRVFGLVLLAVLATIRLQQREKQIQEGRMTPPIEPNIEITTGAWGTVLTSLLSALGIQERAEEPQARITIL